MIELSEYTRQLKERVNILDVAGRLGLGLNSSGHALCFLHADKDPSLHLTQNGSEGFFYCFGCRRGGDAISLVEQYRRMSFREACDWLAQEYGLEPLTALRKNLPADEYDAEINRMARRRRERDTVEAILTDAARYFHRQLPEYLRENILKARALPEQIEVADPAHRLHIIHKWLAEGLPKPDIAYRLGISKRQVYRILEEFVQSDVTLPLPMSQPAGDSRENVTETSKNCDAMSQDAPETVTSCHGLDPDSGVGCDMEPLPDPPECDIQRDSEPVPSVTVYGLNENIIHKILIGYAPTGNGLLTHLRAEGYSDDDLALSGLFLRDKGGRLHSFFHGRLMFPYWKHGRVVYFIGRQTCYTPETQWEQGKYKKLLTRSDRRSYISETVSNAYFYNEDAAFKADDLLITEGVTDCIAAMQHGFACISPVTTSFRDRDVPKLVDLTRNAKRIYLCNDVEANHSGEKGAIRTALQLEAAGRSVYLVTLPAEPGLKTDLNSFFLSHTEADFQRLLDEALPTLDFLVHALPGLLTDEEKRQRVDDILRILSLSRYKEAVDETLAAVKLACPKIRKEDLRKQIATARKNHIQDLRQKKSPLPDIAVNNRQVAAIVSDAWNALLAANTPPKVFLREGSLVQLTRRKTSRGSEMVIQPLEERGMYALHTTIANWVQVHTDGVSDTGPHLGVVRTMLEHPDPRLPVLDDVVTTPVFGRDGTLIQTPGYHPEDCLWYEPSVSLAPIPLDPTPAQMTWARELILQDLFVDFPYSADADQGHGCGALVTCFMRRMIDGLVPFILIEAPMQGSGKGFLASAISLVATGKPPATRTISPNDEEVRKAITAVLQSGAPVILLDNIPERRFDSNALSVLGTSTVWGDRKLGVTLDLTLPNHALWMMTGNNPRLGNDLVRRCLRTRLNRKREFVFENGKPFKHDPLFPWILEHRADLVTAVLLLIQGWIAAGAPLFTERVLPTYEEFCRKVGGVVAFHGLGAFLGNMEEHFRNADEEAQMWREFVAAWWEEYRDAPKTPKDLLALCETHDLLPILRKDGTEKAHQVRLGMALKRSCERIYEGKEIRQRTLGKRKITEYLLAPVEPEGAL